MKTKKYTMILGVIIILLFLKPMKSYAEESGGDTSDYIEIRTADDLYNIRSNMCGKYKLMNDIDLSEVTSSGGKYNYNNKGWNPIGSNNEYSCIPFTGILDGQGYSIKGLHISTSATKVENDYYVGLFAYNKGCICNISFTDIDISANCNMYSGVLYVGCVSGKNDGIISNVTTQNGSIKGVLKASSKTEWVMGCVTEYVSSISAYSSGTIEHCKNSANLVMQTSDDSSTGKTAYGDISGISAGSNDAIMNYCSNIGAMSSTRPYTFSGKSYSSGISAGYGTISNSYNTVSNVDYGITSDGKTNNCYFIGNGKTNKNATNCYFNGSSNSQTGWTQLTTEQMSDQNSFVGFDFDDIWEMNGGSTYRYPVLKIMDYYSPVEIPDSGPKVVKLVIESYPNKLNYIEGQSFIKNGLVISAVYDDNKSIKCVDYLLGECDTTPGKKTIDVSYNNVHTSFEVTYSEKSTVKIEVINQPDKTEYDEGESFDSTGMIVKAYYDNDTSEIIEDYEVSELSGYGNVLVTLTYGGCSDTVSVYIRKIVKSIDFYDEIITLYENEKTKIPLDVSPIDAENKEFIWNSSNESVISFDESGNAIPKNEGTATITASVKGYEDINCTCKVKVVAVVPTGIEISSLPNTTEYLEGETFDESGLAVFLVYNNGKREECKDYTIDTVDSKVGKKTVNVYYDGFETSFEVEFFEKTLSKIEVTTPPDKTTYVEGEGFVADGMVVTATYSCGIEREVKDYSVGEIIGTGEVELVISYGKKSSKIKIKVVSYGSMDELKTLLSKGQISWKNGDVTHTISLNGDAVRFRVDKFEECGFGDIHLYWTYNDLTDYSRLLLDYSTYDYDKYSSIGYTFEAYPSVESYYPGQYIPFMAQVGADSKMNREISRLGSNLLRESTLEWESYLKDNYNISLEKCGFNGIKNKTDDVIKDEAEYKTMRALADNIMANGNIIIKGTNDIISIGYNALSDCIIYEYSFGESAYTKLEYNLSEQEHNVYLESKVTTSTYYWTLMTKLNMSLYDGSLDNNRYLWFKLVKTDYPTTTGDLLDNIRKTAIENTQLSFQKWLTTLYLNYNIDNVHSGFDLTVKKTHDHNWGEGIVLVEPTCSTEGEISYKCNLCGLTIKEKMDVLPHDIQLSEKVNPTCEKDGSVECYKCSRCGMHFYDAEGSSEMEEGAWIIPKTGHKYEVSEYKWSDDNKQCTGIAVCKNDKSHIIAETVNTVGRVIKEPTRDDKGTTEYTATFKNELFKTQTKEVDDLDPLGHEFGVIEYTWSEDGHSCEAYARCKCCDTPVERREIAVVTSRVSVEPKCEEKGKTTYTATFTQKPFEEQKKELEDIEPLGHLTGTAVKENVVKATCSKEGSYEEVVYCTRCKAEISRVSKTEKIDPNNHNWDEGKITKQATCTKAGVKTFTCGWCGKTRTEATSALGHKEVKDSAVAPTTTKTGLTEGSHCSVCGKVIKKQEVIPKVETKKYSNEWVDGKWYNADGTQTYSGTLQWKSNATGWWVEDTDGWYPTDSWQKIDNVWYYFKPDGYMASNEYYNGYWFNADGSWDDKYLLSWKLNSTGWWVEDISGWWPSSSWLKIDGYWYYFDASGYMVTSQYVDGWWISADGVCY